MDIVNDSAREAPAAGPLRRKRRWLPSSWTTLAAAA